MNFNDNISAYDDNVKHLYDTECLLDSAVQRSTNNIDQF